MGDRMFISELRGMRVTASDGRILGRFDDAVVDSGSGKIVFVLVADATENCAQFRKDAKGRKVVEFKDLAIEGNTMVLRL